MQYLGAFFVDYPFSFHEAIAKAQIPKKEAIKNSDKGELYMSSKQWLARHGLRAKKIDFFDFLQTLAFKHCDGVVDIQHAPKGNVGHAVSFLIILCNLLANVTACSGGVVRAG